MQAGQAVLEGRQAWLYSTRRLDAVGGGHGRRGLKPTLSPNRGAAREMQSLAIGLVRLVHAL